MTVYSDCLSEEDAQRNRGVNAAFATFSGFYDALDPAANRVLLIYSGKEGSEYKFDCTLTLTKEYTVTADICLASDEAGLVKDLIMDTIGLSK